MELFRKIYDIEGVVQGVGFRPTLYCYAVELKLGGWIRNCSGKVELAIEGSEGELNYYIENLGNNIPVQARIDSLVHIATEKIKIKSEFKILESEIDSEARVSIPADLAMCPDCEREILDPGDRRYLYPFTTCFNCGPRYTVVNAMPYDRCRTTLNDFPLCEKCMKEYTDPANRRFHAESIACPACGPKLWVQDKSGEEIGTENAIEFIIDKIHEGSVVAIRGIGGYLLAVDASNEQALIKLRQRKNRPDKPFAVMGKNISIVEKYCFVSNEEKEKLGSSAAPIVILDAKNSDLPMGLLSNDANTLGVMVPYSPLHKLLFETDKYELLVMTSGNRGGEPICISNAEAVRRLEGIADYFLCHNREINLRNDDSISCLNDDTIQVWRRARGYAPDSVKLQFLTGKCIFAMGAELKNSVCVLDDNEAVISPHIGDLESPIAVDGLKQVVDCFPKFLNKNPDVIAVDKHPDMQSTKIGKNIAARNNISVVEVQHHHAHAVACMAENGLREAFGVVFDGTGLGDDGNIWGAELIYTDIKSFKRLATFSPVALPGGDAAVYHPVRQLVARLFDAGVREFEEDFLMALNVSKNEVKIWQMQIEKGINSPKTHAAGRLFDSFSMLLGVAPKKVTYEGQAAIRLESFAKRALKRQLIGAQPNFEKLNHNGLTVIDWKSVFLKLFKAKVWNLSLEDREEFALAFHYSVADSAICMLKNSSHKYTTKNVVLSGGVFMNRILTSILRKQLKENGYKVFIHKNVPPNDGGISLGQSVIAASQSLTVKDT